VLNPKQDGYQKTIFEKGIYEPGTISFIRAVLQKGDIFIDIGANIGLMSLVAAQNVGKDGQVYAFEPEPEMYARLMFNLRINDCSNIFAHKLALGSFKETRNIFSFPEINIGRASLVKSSGAVLTGETNVITLTEFLDKEKIKLIKLIKIDVEGFEYEVIEGALAFLKRSKPPIICIECDNQMPRQAPHRDMSLVHENILTADDYLSYRLKDTKFKDNPSLLPFRSIEEVPRHDNAIYVPRLLVKDLKGLGLI
jgi:FkbM family methyltransferase